MNTHIIFYPLYIHRRLSELQTLYVRPLIHLVPLKSRETGTLSEGPGESAGACVRFVDPDLYGNIMTFGEAGLLKARTDRAINACDIGKHRTMRHQKINQTFLSEPVYKVS